MTTLLPGVTIDGLALVETLSGTEAIEVSVPIFLGNGQPSTKSFKTTINDLMRLYALNKGNPNWVTAAQTGAYTIEQVEDLLREKLGVAGIAVNSERLDGMTKQEIIDEARSGTVADSMKLGGQPAEYYVTNVEHDALVDQLVDSFNTTAAEI